MNIVVQKFYIKMSFLMTMLSEWGTEMRKEELEKILENHKHWLNKDCRGWEHMRADLTGANLTGADLTGANLIQANLRGADLTGANLIHADLGGANLIHADLRRADLTGANLIQADLIGADLTGADLREANLRRADLTGADLRRANLMYADLMYADLTGADLDETELIQANLRGANFTGANLTGANLGGADLMYADLTGANLTGADLRRANLMYAGLTGAKNIPYIPLTCPDTGSFIGYKKAPGYIVKLEILEDSRRCSAVGRKCRCDKAKVLSIENFDGSIADVEEVSSDYDSEFVYRVGEIVEEPNYCTDRWNECSDGIHFFINRQEAVDYDF